MISVVVGRASSQLLPLVLVQVMLCHLLHCPSSIVLVCPCFFLVQYLHAVYYAGFCHSDILSTCPNNSSLHWTTLSSRVVSTPINFLISSFLIFCKRKIPAILRSQLIAAVRILFSSCFRIDQYTDPYSNIGCIIESYIFILIFTVNSLLLHRIKKWTRKIKIKIYKEILLLYTIVEKFIMSKSNKYVNI